MAENGNEHVERAWRAFTAALQAMADAMDEDRDEFVQLLNAAMALKLALEDGEILGAGEGAGDG